MNNYNNEEKAAIEAANKKIDATNKTIRYTVRITEKLEQFMKARAEEMDIKPSDYLRMLVYADMRTPEKTNIREDAHRFTIYLTDEMIDFIRTMRAKKGLLPSEYIYEIIQQEMERQGY